MPRSATIPVGSWPRRMPAAIAAGYCGETTVEIFLKRVGKEYPRPRVKEGKELDQQNADGAASPQNGMQASPITKTSVRSQRLTLRFVERCKRQRFCDCRSPATRALAIRRQRYPLNSHFDKLSDFQRATTPFAFDQKTKPAQNFQMRGKRNFQTRPKFQFE